MKIIEKAISIEAPKEKVRDVLPDEEATRIWYAEFCEGAHPESDWKVGGKATFSDGDGNGLIATITQHILAEMISIEYESEPITGKEEYETPVERIKGGQEIYRLSSDDGATQVAEKS